MLLELESDPPRPRARKTAKSSVFDHFEHVGTLSVSDPDALYTFREVYTTRLDFFGAFGHS